MLFQLNAGKTMGLEGVEVGLIAPSNQQFQSPILALVRLDIPEDYYSMS
jgi:hypothetical protein